MPLPVINSDDIADITYSNLCGQTDPCYHEITIKLKDGTKLDGGANATYLGYVLCYIGKRDGRWYHFDYVFANEFYHGFGRIIHKGRWPLSKNYVFLGGHKILLGKQRGPIPPFTNDGEGPFAMAEREEMPRWCCI